ncbi:MAG TPA: hypothetical protein P5236_06000, partial [Paludibacteraceae bacterium]|nr:hypothetical protein [Paludibacteraceae bacterium]
MKEKVKTYKNHFFALFILMIIGFNACTPSKKGITILNSGTDSYTSLQISNPFGRAVTFIGNENVGAIGYELDGKTFWVKGYPEITVLVDSTLNYCWKQEERQVIMNVKEKEKETRFKF